ncbi:peptide-methionine (S)-S-oxide reductase [Duganella sp. BJB488]|uniref:peptide-methionine (S)-S-oxide reductase MsrA n=1 Tax=unclassified Duganella TaxID=2636909 RepID=UPI000E349953|nr:MULTISPECIES: peptide-methionine (S)-S-oxide reductase MsrA [unclassified Duganella]NVD72586.1 peptide-methionine (S)-S-oxide reductase MsrA [Duganella sp. BJB1802]RFP20202.1 peptide-methionine (S)-S-oxide reductase [Duganella sp. BJB489]RFP21350.1 peptide-methionine (S)-S-oxide reductase [Duganella sp. BJB488]RFP33491.1 peptide-methionine (S)-S-oxide reductase [Duganella sp. BJB480]
MNSFLKNYGGPLALAGAAIFGVALWQQPAVSAEVAVAIAPPAVDEPAPTGHTATAIFAGGCFWGVQGVFQHVKGVSNALSGYAGGDGRSANYDAVSGGDTGHAESVKITYDPAQISYGKLLQIFFSVAHNPTELNRQGPDSGTQYRSAIFPRSPAQRSVAEKYIAQLNASHVFKKPLTTRIEMDKAFYPAEAYHQNFLTLNPNHPYIAFNDLPKVENLKRIAPDVYRADPVLVRKGL